MQPRAHRSRLNRHDAGGGDASRRLPAIAVVWPTCPSTKKSNDTPGRCGSSDGAACAADATFGDREQWPVPEGVISAGLRARCGVLSARARADCQRCASAGDRDDEGGALSSALDGDPPVANAAETARFRRASGDDADRRTTSAGPPATGRDDDGDDGDRHGGKAREPRELDPANPRNREPEKPANPENPATPRTPRNPRTPRTREPANPATPRTRDREP